MVFKFEISASSVDELSRKNFLELLRTLLPRPHQVLHRQLQGEQWILEFVRQAPRQFAPGRDPLGLHQAFPLLEKFSRHTIEGFGQGSQFVGRIHGNTRVPVSRRHLPRRLRQLFNRSRDPGRGPSAEQNGENEADAPRQQGGRANAIAQLNIGTPRVAHQQNAQ